MFPSISSTKNIQNHPSLKGILEVKHNSPNGTSNYPTFIVKKPSEGPFGKTMYKTFRP